MAHVHIIAQSTVNENHTAVLTITDEDPVDPRMLKAGGWLPVRVITHEDAGCHKSALRPVSTPMGFHAVSAFLRRA